MSIHAGGSTMISMKRSRPALESLENPRKIQRTETTSPVSVQSGSFESAASWGIRHIENNVNNINNINNASHSIFGSTSSSGNLIDIENNKFGSPSVTDRVQRSEPPSVFGVTPSEQAELINNNNQSEVEEKQNKKLERLVAQTLRFQSEKLQAAHHELQFKDNRIRSLESELGMADQRYRETEHRLRESEQVNNRLKESIRQLQFIIHVHSQMSSGNTNQQNFDHHDFFNPPDIF